MQRIAGQLLELAETNALGAWAIAVRFQLVDAAKAAAKLCLKTPLPWPFVEELEHITGADYHHLVEYREMHVKAACDVLTDLVSELEATLDKLRAAQRDLGVAQDERDASEKSNEVLRRRLEEKDTEIYRLLLTRPAEEDQTSEPPADDLPAIKISPGA